MKDGVSTTLTVTVHKRNGVLYRGIAESVSGTNDVGPFDILPLHANFVSIVKDSLIIRSGKEQTFQFERGILRVFENTIEVYIGV